MKIHVQSLIKQYIHINKNVIHNAPKHINFMMNNIYVYNIVIILSIMYQLIQHNVPQIVHIGKHYKLIIMIIDSLLNNVIQIYT